MQVKPVLSIPKIDSYYVYAIQKLILLLKWYSDEEAEKLLFPTPLTEEQMYVMTRNGLRMDPKEKRKLQRKLNKLLKQWDASPLNKRSKLKLATPAQPIA